MRGDTLIGLTHLRHAEIGVEASTLCPQTICVGAKLHQFNVTCPQEGSMASHEVQPQMPSTYHLFACYFSRKTLKCRVESEVQDIF